MATKVAGECGWVCLHGPGASLPGATTAGGANCPSLWVGGLRSAVLTRSPLRFRAPLTTRAPLDNHLYTGIPGEVIPQRLVKLFG